LYSQGANPHTITTCHENAVLLACKSGNLALVQWLHSLRVNLHLKDTCGQTALFYASSQGHTHLVPWLCQHLPVNDTTHHGSTPLLQACRYGHLDTARCLYHRGASISIHDDLHHSPLYYAIQQHHLPIVQWLCSFGVPCDEYLLSTTNAECLELLFLHGGLNYDTPFIDTFKKTFKWKQIRSRLKKHYLQRRLCLSRSILDFDDLMETLLNQDLAHPIGDFVGILRDSPWKQILSVK
jgi:ankyrin repeat protein